MRTVTLEHVIDDWAKWMTTDCDGTVSIYTDPKPEWCDLDDAWEFDATEESIWRRLTWLEPIPPEEAKASLKYVGL